jgi:hypothetical protein
LVVEVTLWWADEVGAVHARPPAEEDDMELSSREFWTVLHGMGFGAVYLLAFAGGLAGLYSLRPGYLTAEGLEERTHRLKIGMWVMAVIAWFTVVSGTWTVYIWYRAKPGAGADLSQFPRALLLSSPKTQEWHNFGMEWKEHVAWIVPMVATSLAFVIGHYGRKLVEMQALRRALMWLLVISFGAAAAAGVFGAFINKVAPTH